MGMDMPIKIKISVLVFLLLFSSTIKPGGVTISLTRDWMGKAFRKTSMNDRLYMAAMAGKVDRRVAPRVLLNTL
jgi:hypothetical protein